MVPIMTSIDHAPAQPHTSEHNARLNRSLRNRLFLFHCSLSKDLRTELAQTAIVRMVMGKGNSTSQEEN